MKQFRLSTLALAGALVISSGLLILATPAQSQFGAPKAYVSLQPTSPGTSQSGHANLSGTVRANAFIGSGAGLHSLSGDAISSGIVSGEFLPNSVAMEDEGNTFTAANLFSGQTTFNGLTRLNGFTGVKRTSGQLTPQESFGIGEASTDFDGMYIKTAQTGRPFYGYQAGTASAWTWLDGSSNMWSLNVANIDMLRVNGQGVGINGAPSGNSEVRLHVYGRAEFAATTSGVEGIVDIVQAGSGNGIQSIAYGNGAGVLARTGNPNGQGLYADNTTNSGVAAYCFGWGSTSTGVRGVGGSYGAEGHSTSGVGVHGVSANNYGVQGESTNSHGVIGLSQAAEAVVGRTFAPNKSAVHGYTDVVGSHGGFFWSAAATGAGIGVIGQGNSATGYGVQSIGRFMATGVKSFRIDHPLDPENKYLSHFCAEGPEPLNIYSGEAHTDSNGYAVVQLPNYFSEINRDPRVQLTVDDASDDFVMVKVVGGVTGNSFRIRTNKPGVRVYWEVKAIRNDLWVRRYGATAETQKPDRERGTYQHPELYNAPASQGLYVVDAQLAERRSVPTFQPRKPLYPAPSRTTTGK